MRANSDVQNAKEFRSRQRQRRLTENANRAVVNQTASISLLCLPKSFSSHGNQICMAKMAPMITRPIKAPNRYDEVFFIVTYSRSLYMLPNAFHAMPSAPPRAPRARKCKGCLGTTCKACHGTEQNPQGWPPAFLPQFSVYQKLSLIVSRRPVI